MIQTQIDINILSASKSFSEILTTKLWYTLHPPKAIMADSTNNNSNKTNAEPNTNATAAQKVADLQNQKRQRKRENIISQKQTSPSSFSSSP